MGADLVGRVKTRFLDGEAVPSDDVIGEVLTTVQDRLKIRLDVSELPDVANSIVVDAAMKALRLRGYEGSTSESSGDGGSISNSFVSGILEEYEQELATLQRSLHKRRIKFV